MAVKNNKSEVEPFALFAGAGGDVVKSAITPIEESFHSDYLSAEIDQIVVDVSGPSEVEPTNEEVETGVPVLKGLDSFEVRRLSEFDNQDIGKHEESHSKVGEFICDKSKNVFYSMWFNLSKSRVVLGQKYNRFHHKRAVALSIGVASLLAASPILLQSDSYETGNDDNREAELPSVSSTSVPLEISIARPEVNVINRVIDPPSTVIENVATTTTTTTTTTTSPGITAVAEPVAIEDLPTETIAEQIVPETTTPPVVVDIYKSLNCSLAESVIERGWTISEIAQECGLKQSTLESYNPQINDFSNIIVGTRINLVRPTSSTSTSQSPEPSTNAPKIECVAIGGVIKPLAAGFTIEGYLKNLGYSNKDALFLAYSTSLASDYGLVGDLIAGNNYCLPTTNGIAIRYDVKIG